MPTLSQDEVDAALAGDLSSWHQEGDAITHSSRQPHHNRNPGPGRAVILFCSTPPSF